MRLSDRVAAVERQDDAGDVDRRRDARKTTVSARCAGWPSRRVGICASSASRRSGVSRSRPGVACAPGASTLTVTPWSATSMASALVRPMTPAFAVAYAVALRTSRPPLTAAIEAMLMIRPWCWSSIDGSTARVTLKTELRLRSIWVVHVADVISWNGLTAPPPAPLSRTSTPPHSATIFPTASWTASKSVRSTAADVQRRPWARTSSPVASSPAASRSSPATSAPSAAKVSAMTRPRAPAAPVTTARWPSRRMVVLPHRR